MATYERVNLLSLLSVGRNPNWTEQTTGSSGSGDPAFTGAPTSAGSGVSMAADSDGSAVQALAVIQLRENPAKRTMRVYEANHVAGQTYNVDVDLAGAGGSVPYVSVPADTWEDVVLGLVAALPGVPAVAALATFTAEDLDSDGTYDTLRVQTIAEAGLSFDADATGAATVRIVMDPETCNARVWVAPTGDASSSVTHNPSTWYAANGGYYLSLTYRGWMERLEVSGFDRAYIELDTVAGLVGDGLLTTAEYQDEPTVTNGHTGARVFWGPCIDEET